ncbi:unnamed protein product [Mytilus edulis]|uniref:Uncharacterized protein n=1 Tax=Mytilus edulis TaxID=6550 RepID=A0A8S3S560_MYTED|nr:unnamed protein product [Mytilus edulis]
MAMESLGLILMIPFCVCFILLFVVCCFAEQLKRMCRMPSQLPRSQTDTRRRRNRRSRRLYDLSGPPVEGRRPTEEDVEALLRSRRRTESGDSTDTQSCPCNVVIITNESGMTSYVESQSFLNLAGLSASQTLNLAGPLSISQTVITNVAQNAGESYGSARSLGQSNLSFTVIEHHQSQTEQNQSQS